MNEEDLLKNEKVGKVLSPHPLSFMKYQALCIFLIVWGVLIGWLVNFSEYSSMFGSNEWFPILVWATVLLVVGIIASLITVRWSIFGLFFGIFIGGVALILWQGWISESDIFIPFYMIAASIIGFLIVEWYRRSHKYIISNQRITFKGGILTKEERTLRYDKITDINAKQGIIGQIFGFGTIIPISQSGFGLGSDESFAAGGIQVGEKKAKFFGMAGGGREVQTPRARSYHELHGVYPYKEVKKLVEELVQEKDVIPYHQKNAEYQKEQETFQKEQIDIQKQMRDLLKTQSKPKDGESVEEDVDEGK